MCAGGEDRGAEVFAKGKSALEIVMEGNIATCTLSFDEDEPESLSGKGGKGRDLERVRLADEALVAKGEPLPDAWRVPSGKPSPTPPGSFLDRDALDSPSWE